MAFFRRGGKEEEDEQSARQGPAPDMSGMTREMRRMMKKSGGGDRPTRPPMVKRQRTKPREFVRQVIAELNRVAWPRRKEVFTYTVVVLVSVSFFMAIIGGMDFVAARAVLELISRR